MRVEDRKRKDRRNRRKDKQEKRKIEEYEKKMIRIRKGICVEKG